MKINNSKYFGKKAIVTKQFDNILPGSIVILRGKGTCDTEYATEMTETVFWEGNSDCAHDCNELFDENIGYYIDSECLKLYEEESGETIEEEFELPTNLK